VPVGIGFGVGAVIVRPLWLCCALDWRQRRIQLDIARFNALNRRWPGIETSVWRHDRSRLCVAPRDFAWHTRVHVLRGSAISAATITQLGGYPCHVPPREMRQHPIGTGPFKFLEFKPKESIKVMRNPDYWKKGRPTLTGSNTRSLRTGRRQSSLLSPVSWI
jgi:hypothetical protein